MFRSRFYWNDCCLLSIAHLKLISGFIIRKIHTAACRRLFKTFSQSILEPSAEFIPQKSIWTITGGWYAFYDKPPIFNTSTLPVIRQVTITLPRYEWSSVLFPWTCTYFLLCVTFGTIVLWGRCSSNYKENVSCKGCSTPLGWFGRIKRLVQHVYSVE